MKLGASLNFQKKLYLENDHSSSFPNKFPRFDELFHLFSDNTKISHFSANIQVLILSHMQTKSKCMLSITVIK